MKKAVTALVLFDSLFIVLLAVAGSIPGIFGDVFYYFAFIAPLFLAFSYIKGSLRDEEPPRLLSLLPTKKSLFYLLPLIAPFVLSVMLISYLTSLLLTAIGFSSAVELSGGAFAVVMRHAVLPSFFEEALFRYVPLAILLPFSKKGAAVISALFFAGVHCSLFQIPYAFFAGLVLAYACIASGNIFPAVILHFVNNLASLLYTAYGEDVAFKIVFFSVLGGLALISLVFIFVKRKSYIEEFKSVFDKKCKLEFTNSGVAFVAATLIAGVLNLWLSL